MCDTIVAVPPSTADAAVWFGKNSDREPGEAQLVEQLPARAYAAGARLQCTYLEIEQAPRTHEVLLSRPFWMWGAEMGANEHGLAIGNEAVFTRLPVPKTGLTGMDLLRLALERATTARDALDRIVHWIATVGQGGVCGYRNKGFRYHNSFLLADPAEAWVLETADRFWAAERVRGVRTISNVLTIGKEFDLLAEGAYEFARAQGWCQSAADFDFARAFGDPLYRLTTGGDLRRACTHGILARDGAPAGRERLFAALRDHAGLSPADGWRLQMPCAHASWQITRQAGQTTGSMVSRLQSGRSLHWLTGTSSPCLSVFKPVRLGAESLPFASTESLFWRHEALHRRVLADYEGLHALVDAPRHALETRGLADDPSPALCRELWTAHHDALPAWCAHLDAYPARDRRSVLAQRYWRRQSLLDRERFSREHDRFQPSNQQPPAGNR